MIIEKNNPIGVDCVISKIQRLIYDNVSWILDDYISYQRAYKNETNRNLIWEAFYKYNDYREVLFNDYFATSFFIIGDNISYELGRQRADISVIFQINLKELYPNILHRADEEAHQEILNILDNSPYSKYVDGVQIGIRNVYTEIGYGANKFDDLQPCHVFRINLNNVIINCR